MYGIAKSLHSIFWHYSYFTEIFFLHFTPKVILKFIPKLYPRFTPKLTPNYLLNCTLKFITIFIPCKNYVFRMLGLTKSR